MFLKSIYTSIMYIYLYNDLSWWAVFGWFSFQNLLKIIIIIILFTFWIFNSYFLNT